MNRYFMLITVVVAFLALAACSSGGDGQALVGPVWILTDLNGNPPLPDTTISAQFEEAGAVGGSGGCNNYTTSYEVSGDSISFGEQMAVTAMLCLDPINEQERAYFEALGAAETFQIRDDELELRDGSGDAVASFVAQSQELEGSSWEVIAYNNGRGGVTSLIIGTEITTSFGDDGRLTGNAGCNEYFSDYEVDGENITIGSIEHTERFCAEPEGVMNQEDEYLAALATAATYRIEANSMNMRTAEGATVANFSRAR